MPTSKSKFQIHIDRDIINEFDKLYPYPGIKHVFAQRAFELALKDRKFFESVFFNTAFIEVK